MATTTNNTPKPLIEYCRGAVEALTAQYNMTKVVPHNVSTGGIREAILRDFLAAHLPDLVTAMSGVVFDSAGTYSKQQDIVFALKSFPRLPFASGVDLIYVEGVVACIEVKTRVAPIHWTDTKRATIGENIASVRKLSPSVSGSTVLGDLDWDVTRIFSAVVTYGGSALADIQDAIVSRGEDEWPDVYIDFSRGMLVNNANLLMPAANDQAFTEVADPALAFARFITFLTRVTGRTVTRGVTWDAYLA